MWPFSHVQCYPKRTDEHPHRFSRAKTPNFGDEKVIEGLSTAQRQGFAVLKWVAKFCVTGTPMIVQRSTLVTSWKYKINECIEVDFPHLGESSICTCTCVTVVFGALVIRPYLKHVFVYLVAHVQTPLWFSNALRSISSCWPFWHRSSFLIVLCSLA